MKRYLALVLVIGIFNFSYAQYTETINSNRPGASFGAFSVGTNVIQLEGGIGFGNDTHELRQTDTDLSFFDYSIRYGLFLEELEVILEGRFLSANQSIVVGTLENEFRTTNFETNTFGVKYLVYDPYKKRQNEGPNVYSYHANRKFKWRDLVPAVSVYAGANLLFGDNGFMFEDEPSVSPKLAISTQNNFDRTVIVINLIADKFTTDFPSYSGIFTVTHAIGQRFSIFGEYQAIVSDIYSDDIFRAGGAYLFNKDFQFDFFGLVNFKDTPQRWLFGLGLSYRFDQFHKDTPLDSENNN
jgi:hypothetical protein